MDVIVIESTAFKNIITKLDNLELYFNQVTGKQPLSESWLSVPEACKFLNVSKRTLQNYRVNGSLAYSRVGGKIYMSSSSIEAHLKNFNHRAFRKPDKFL